MLEFFGISGIFLDFFIIFLKKPNLQIVQIHLVIIYRSYNFLGEFSDPEQFFFFSFFLRSSYQKKSVHCRKLSPTKSVQIGQSERPKSLWAVG